VNGLNMRRKAESISNTQPRVDCFHLFN